MMDANDLSLMLSHVDIPPTALCKQVYASVCTGTLVLKLIDVE